MTKTEYKRTFLLGFGFFAVSITWSIYNAFMPKLLNQYITSTALIGFIMTIDNYLAIFIQPAVGAYSDTLSTRFGRRMPFLMIGMPLAALGAFLIPNHTSLLTLVLFLLFLNVSMSLFRSPVIALMPDLTRENNRSKANSIINFMGGIAALLAFAIGAILWDLNKAFPFYLAGICILLSLVILFTFIKEKRDVLHYERAEEKIKIKEGFKVVFQNRNTRFLLLSIMAWFIGFNGIETLFTLYGEKYLHVEVSAAAFSFSFISLSFLIFAIPAGIIGTKIGKKRTIMIGVISAIVILFCAAFIKSLLIIRILFVLLGICWALININSYPFVTDMAPIRYLGLYTGMYYLFSSIANIVSPPLLGFLMDKIGYQVMFFYGSAFFLLAYLLIRNVKIGEEKNQVIEM
ncbi:MAG: MFS transporter [Bacillaceae bacterium]